MINNTSLDQLKQRMFTIWLVFHQIIPTSLHGNDLIILIPVVPHKAVAEVSKIGNL